MKRLTCVLPFFLLMAAASRQASAIVTLGTSNESFGLTGIGPNSAGQGQSSMTWGNCLFDGTTTSCTVSGSYTGLGNGGTYTFVVSYAGKGAFPLEAITQNPSDNFWTALATNNFNFVITLTDTDGTIIHFYDFANFQFLYSTPTCTGLAAGNCAVGQVGQTPNATIIGQITGTFDPTPSISTGGVVSAAGYGGFPSIAPSTWIEIYGINLANVRSQTWTAADFTGINAPSALGGTKVTIAGSPAYVDFVSPNQVNVQVPSAVPTGSQPLIVTTVGGSSLQYTVDVNPVEPGLLAPAAFKLKGSQYVVALFANTLTYVLPVQVAGVTTARCKPGDSLTLYGIGFGLVTPDTPAGQLVQSLNQLQDSNFEVDFAGTKAEVTYAGLAPGYVGLYQFNVVVPNVAPSDTVPVTFTLDGAAGSQSLVIPVQ